MHVSSLWAVIAATLVLAGPVQRAEIDGSGGDVESYVLVNEVVYYMNGVATSTSFETSTVYETVAASTAAATPVSTGSSSPPASGGSFEQVVPGPGALTVGSVPAQSEAFINIALYHTNIHRANHSAPLMAWNDTIASWAQVKANTCVFNEDR